MANDDVVSIKVMLVEVGLGNLPPAIAESLEQACMNELEMQVGQHLADLMSNDQLDEFERLFETGDDKASREWLNANFPDHKSVVGQKLAELKTVLTARSADIIAAAKRLELPLDGPG